MSHFSGVQLIIFKEREPWFTPICYVLCTLQELKAISCSHVCEHVKTTSVSFICHIPFTNACCMFWYACRYLLLLMCFVTKGQQSLSCTLSMCDNTRSLLLLQIISECVSWIAVFLSQLCQQVNFELHHCENLRCHTELFLCTNVVLCYHILNGFKLLKPGMLWLWFWSTEEDKSAVATMYEILTVINTKITVLLIVILHSLVDRYSYTSVLHRFKIIVFRMPLRRRDTNRGPFNIRLPNTTEGERQTHKQSFKTRKLAGEKRWPGE